jgi:recombination DNA repair RAD52 pathway protein
MRRMYQQQSTTDLEPVGLSWIPETMATEISPITIIHGTSEVEEEITEEISVVQQVEGYLGVPSKTSVSTSGSVDTLMQSAPTSPSNLSSVTLVGSTGSGDKGDEAKSEFQYGKVPTSPLPERAVPKRPPRTIEQQAAATETPPVVTKAPSPKPIIDPKQKQPSIMKTPPTTTTKSLTLQSTVITTSMLTAAIATQKTTISPPSIGVTFDR